MKPLSTIVSSFLNTLLNEDVSRGRAVVTVSYSVSGRSYSYKHFGNALFMNNKRLVVLAWLFVFITSSVGQVWIDATPL